MTAPDLAPLAARLHFATVAICGSCSTYLPAEDAGTECPMEHDCGQHPKLRRRRGFICARCEERFFFGSRYEWEKHQEAHDANAQ